MSNPKLRRVFALTALIAALSMLPAQAAGFSPREPRRASLVERFESWGASAWSFLSGLLEKRSSVWDPNGVSASAEGGH
ncbi:MAG TPA: hypothetical protein VIC28_14430 [Thermoanaerobaculia bacterium]|jgi:hypothetical protein